MTEDAVRAVFLRHYSVGSLNEALRVTSEEVALAILSKLAGDELSREGDEMPKPAGVVPDIVTTIIRGKSRIGFFTAMFAAGIENPVAPMTLIFHFDHVRKAMLDAINYMHGNYETADQFFKERFPKEDLKMMSGDMSEAIEKPSGLPDNVRGISFAELKKEDEFFSFALAGIFGTERFQEYANEYNEALKVLRQCQAEGKALVQDLGTVKES